MLNCDVRKLIRNCYKTPQICDKSNEVAKISNLFHSLLGKSNYF